MPPLPHLIYLHFLSVPGAQSVDDFLTPLRLLPAHLIAPFTSLPYRLSLHAKALVDVEWERRIV